MNADTLSPTPAKRSVGRPPKKPEERHNKKSFYVTYEEEKAIRNMLAIIRNKPKGILLHP